MNKLLPFCSKHVTGSYGQVEPHFFFFTWNNNRAGALRKYLSNWYHPWEPMQTQRGSVCSSCKSYLRLSVHIKDRSNPEWRANLSGYRNNDSMSFFSQTFPHDPGTLIAPWQQCCSWEWIHRWRKTRRMTAKRWTLFFLCLSDHNLHRTINGNLSGRKWKPSL